MENKMGEITKILARIAITIIGIWIGLAIIQNMLNQLTENRAERIEKAKSETQKKAQNKANQEKETSDLCRFWRQQTGINPRAPEKIKQHCHTKPDTKKN